MVFCPRELYQVVLTLAPCLEKRTVGWLRSRCKLVAWLLARASRGLAFMSGRLDILRGEGRIPVRLRRHLPGGEGQAG